MFVYSHKAQIMLLLQLKGSRWGSLADGRKRKAKRHRIFWGTVDSARNTFIWFFILLCASGDEWNMDEEEEKNS